MKPNPNIIFIIFTACIVAAGAYWYFFVEVATEPSLMASETGNMAEQQFQALVTQLPRDFSTQIFSDPEFQALQDLTTAIAPEPPGRVDPFAPLTGVSAQP